GTTPLSLIVFRDESTFGMLHASVIVVFALLMLAYALPLTVLGARCLTRRIYPLENLWPCATMMPLYLAMMIAHVATLTAFGLAYANTVYLENLIVWPAVLV